MTATAKMIFTQAPGGARPAGHAVEDGVVGNQVTVTNEDDTDVDSWSLELLDKPAGPEADCTSALSTGQFASGMSPPVTGNFAPDAYHSYLVRLTVNGTITHESTFSCPDETGAIRPPFMPDDDVDADALKYGGQLRGWAYNLDRIHADVRFAFAMLTQTTAVKTTAYVAAAGELVRCDASGGGFTVSLPKASDHPDAVVCVKKTVSTANVVLVDCDDAGDTLDGSTSDSLNQPLDSGLYKSDGGANWMSLNNVGIGVTGPGSSTDNAVPRWSGTGGNALIDSGVTLDGSDNLAGLNSVAIGTTVAATGDVRGHDTLTVKAWGTGSIDVEMLSKDGDDYVTVGGANAARAILYAGGAARLTAHSNIDLNIATLSWASANTATITQQTKPSGDANDFTIQSGGATSGIAGDLILQVGSSSTGAGALRLKDTGGNDRFTITGTGGEVGINNVGSCIFTTSGWARFGLAAGSGPGSAASVGAVRLQGGAPGYIVFRKTDDSAEAAGMHYDNTNLWVGGPYPTRPYAVRVSADYYAYLQTSSGVASQLIVGNDICELVLNNLLFDQSVTSPKIGHEATTSSPAASLTLEAQATSGDGGTAGSTYVLGGDATHPTNGTGGDVVATPGVGNTAAGSVKLTNAASTVRFQCDSTGLAFFAGTPVAQQAVTGALSSVTDANAKAVLTSIIAALAAASGYNLVTDSTT